MKQYAPLGSLSVFVRACVSFSISALRCLGGGVGVLPGFHLVVYSGVYSSLCVCVACARTLCLLFLLLSLPPLCSVCVGGLGILGPLWASIPGPTTPP